MLLLINDKPEMATTDTLCSQRMTLDIRGSRLQIAYCGNVDIDTSSSQIERILVIIHGRHRNANDYCNYIIDAGRMAGGSDQTTAIVAPYFLIEDDLDQFNLSENMLFWSSSGWKKGDNSIQSTNHPRAKSISSYAVVDELIDRLIANNPNASQVVIAGHSAGGQFVNRYIAGSRVETWNPEISFRYLVANPSSWLYFSPERVLKNCTDIFKVPDPGNCPDYNDYKYGLLNLNSYMSAIGSSNLKQNYQDRNVIYLLGELDKNPNVSLLDTNCAGMLQGEGRLQRGEIYFNYVNSFFGMSNLANHRKEIVIGVGHSASNMFQSDYGLYFLYDYSSTSTSQLLPILT